jgi:hypothetical protein
MAKNGPLRGSEDALRVEVGGCAVQMLGPAKRELFGDYSDRWDSPALEGYLFGGESLSGFDGAERLRRSRTSKCRMRRLPNEDAP